MTAEYAERRWLRKAAGDSASQGASLNSRKVLNSFSSQNDERKKPYTDCTTVLQQ